MGPGSDSPANDSREPMVGGRTAPHFGSWNKNPEEAECFSTQVFNQNLRETMTPAYNPTNEISCSPLRIPMKQSKQSEVLKSGFTKQVRGRSMMTPNEPQIILGAGPSQMCEGSEYQMADEGCSMSSDSHAKSHATKCAGGLLFEKSLARVGERGSGSQTPSFGTLPVPNWAQSGTGSFGYKAMDNFKQRLCDVVSHKKNIGVLQTNIQVLMEEIAQVQTLLMSGENDTKDEVQHWLIEANEILKEANGILNGRNNMADKKRLCSSCWDPTSSWEVGQMLRDIDRILEERKSLDLSSYFCEVSYCNKLQSRENKLQELLKALMDIHISMIGIYGMIGVGKTILAEELARRAANNKLFDTIVRLQVSRSLDIKLIQAQIASKIGLQLSEVDDEETRARFLYNALKEKTMEQGQECDTEAVQRSKILVILDGIQRVIDLGMVGIPFKLLGRASCKVVLISRSADVCKNMGAEKQFLMECLSLDEAKILFQARLGDKIEGMALERYQYMENVFLIKCRGLPLAIDSLACALRSMSWSNWELTVDQMERRTLVEVDGLKDVSHAILKLCDYFIQNGAKRKLFLLCCLIQQGVDLSVVRLMRYGIGLGLFEDDSLASVVDQVNSWVNELKSISLLFESKETHHLLVHDIVQDVAISSLSQGNFIFPVLLDAGTRWCSRESYENCAAISLAPDSNYKCVNGLELDKLQACLLKGKPSLSLPNHFFQGMRNLNILDISGITFVDFPSSIGDLKNLVTLHLEYCDIKCQFASTIGNLAKLEVLSLRESTVETLSEEIGHLTNLRVLDLTCCKVLRTFCVDAVAKLHQLRGLYLYSIHWDLSTDEMMKMKSLPLEVLEIIIPNPFQVSFNVLNLSRFMICLGSRIPDTLQGDLGSFSRVLLINGDVGLQLRENDRSYFLSMTEFLLIDEVHELPNGIGDLNIHSFLHLKELHLHMCNGMKCFLDTSKLSIIQRDMFPELEILTLALLHDLTSICAWLPCCSFFPKLRELRLVDLFELHPRVLPIQLALKLEVLELSNCGSLLYIFSTSEICGAELSVELPHMKIMKLKNLHRLLALQNVLEPSITRSELLRSHLCLFNEKIKLPSLEELHLTGLDEICELWDFSGPKECAAELLQIQTLGKEPYIKSPCFGNLKYMTVSNCNRLESLLSPPITTCLLQLEKLEVECCDNLKEVVTSDIEDSANPTTVITFPKLQALVLKSLNRLQCFYQGCLQLEFPILRELDLSHLCKIKAFTQRKNQLVQTESTILFDGEIDFASVEHLQLCSMNIDFITRHEDTTIFPKLSRLTLDSLQNLKSLPNINSKTLRFLDLQKIECFKVLFSTQVTCILPSMPCVLLQELEELKLSECGSAEALIDDEKSVENRPKLDFELLVALRRLELCCLSQLKKIPWDKLTNLRSLHIQKLSGWTSLMPTTLLAGGNGLPILESIYVGFCRTLEAIISKEDQEDADFVKYGITLLPCLRHITLESVPKLKSFSLGSYEAHFPSLKTVEINQCHSLQLFSSGPVQTPRLESVILDHKTINTNILGDLVAIKPPGRVHKQQQHKPLWSRPGRVYKVSPISIEASTSDFESTVRSLAGTTRGQGLSNKVSLDLQEYTLQNKQGE